MNINIDLPKLYIPVLLSLGLVLTLGHSEKILASESSPNFSDWKEKLYTEASLKGEYAYIAVGEGGRVKVEGSGELAPAGEGAVGVFKFDGSGNGSCGTITAVQIVAGQEEPGKPGQPIPGVVSEYKCDEVTYKVRSPNDGPDIPGDPQPLPQQNGTGMMEITLKLENTEAHTSPNNSGSGEITFKADFAITKAEKIFGNLVATEIFFIQQDLTKSGNLVTGVLKRRPKSNLEYSNASLQGTYTFASIGRYGATPQARTGIVTYDGKGTGSGFAIANFNFPPDPAKRVVFRGNVSDVSEVNKDGTGTFRFTNGTRYAAIVITQAEKIRGQLIATEIFFLNFDPCCQFIPVAQPGLNFTTTVVTRLPN